MEMLSSFTQKKSAMSPYNSSPTVLVGTNASGGPVTLALDPFSYRRCHNDAFRPVLKNLKTTLEELPGGESPIILSGGSLKSSEFESEVEIAIQELGISRDRIIKGDSLGTK